MNKVLHGLVYVFLVLAAAALYFELQLNAKRSELTDRNTLQEDYLVKIARTVEKAGPDKGATLEMKKDSSPVEARLVDSPDMENLLEGYPAYLEEANLETFDWGEKEKEQLKANSSEPLNKLFNAAKAQQARLNSTRDELAKLREKFDQVVSELNALKGEARQDKVALDEETAKVAEAESARAALQGQVTKAKSEIDELNTQISSLRDEVNSAKDETEAKADELKKAKDSIASLKKIIQESIQTTAGAAQSASATAAAVSTVKAGNNKGKIVDVDNDNMFAIIEFAPETMDELRGGDAAKPLPQMEFGVRRPGYTGAAGEFIGRVRIRQEVKGKNYVVCDVLGAWEQDKLAKNDVLFAD